MSENVNEELVKLVKSLQEEIAELKKPKVKAAVKKKKRKYTPRKKKVEATEVVEDGPEFNVKRIPGPARFDKNLFKDDGTIASQDKEFNKKYGKRFSVQPRLKEAAKIIEVKCQYCPAKEKVSSKIVKMKDGEPYHVCLSCVRKGVRR